MLAAIGARDEVLAPVLERCDAEGVPAYLESSKESNVSFYRRHGFDVTGGTPLRGATVDSGGDHRLAMAFAIAALGATAPVTIEDAGCVAISHPSFFADLEVLCRA